MKDFFCNPAALKALLFISVPIILWLVIGATVAYIGKRAEAAEEAKKLKFEDGND